MTWTVTALGTAGTTTPATSVTSGTISAAAGTAVAIFVQYTDFANDSIAAHDSASNPGWTLQDTIVDSGTGQGLAILYNLSLGSSITTITSTFGSATVQTMGMIKFTNSVAGTPTVDGHSIRDNSTGTTTPNSGTGNSTNGDLVLAAIIGDTSSFVSPSLGITGATASIQNNANSTIGYLDGSGTTTTTGNVTSTWTMGSSRVAVVGQLIFAPPIPPPSGIPVWLYGA